MEQQPDSSMPEHNLQETNIIYRVNEELQYLMKLIMGKRNIKDIMKEMLN